MRSRSLALFTILITAVVIGAGAQDALAVRVTMQVIASDPNTASRAASNWAESVGGYFTYRSENQVVLRVPPEEVSSLRALIEASPDTLVSYNPSAVDHREELARNAAAISSRNEALNRILTFLEDSNVVATLSFERELRQLLQEVEYYSGRNRRIRNEIDFASVVINLSSRQRTIPEQRPSTFAWVNTVDLYRFLEEAQP